MMMNKETYDQLQAELAKHFFLFLQKARLSVEQRWGYNAYLYASSLQAYLRVRHRYIDNADLWSLDIASIEVKKQATGQGHFSIFMDIVQKMNPCVVSYLENVHNPLLQDWCERHGWKKVLHMSATDFYYEERAYERTRSGIEKTKSEIDWSIADEERSFRSYQDWKDVREAFDLIRIEKIPGRRGYKEHRTKSDTRVASRSRPTDIEAVQ